MSIVDRFLLTLLATAVLGIAAPMPADPMDQRVLRFSDESPLVDREGKIIQPVPPRIDIAKESAGPIEPLDVGEWTIASWNFPAWVPGGKHYPELAYGAPLRMPLLYDSENPEAWFNGIMYYDLSDRRAMDWQVKWKVEHGINLVLFDWYPSGSREQFDRGIQKPHRHINAAIEVGFLGKEEVGGPPVATNPYEDVIDFAIMWTNHGNAWIPEGTMEYACEQYFPHPNYYKVDGERPLVIIHSAGNLNDEHAGEPGPGRLERLQAYLQRQRDIASEYGYDIYLALGQLAPQYSQHFKTAGFDGVMNYVALPGEEDSHTIRLERTTVRTGQVNEGKLTVSDFAATGLRYHRANWSEMQEFWGRDFVPTITMREDWRHWHVNPRMFYIHGGTPARYEKVVREAMAFIEERDMRRFLIAGIWNEIYEDAYLEPDIEYGFEYLKALRRALLAEKP